MKICPKIPGETERCPTCYMAFYSDIEKANHHTKCKKSKNFCNICYRCVETFRISSHVSECHEKEVTSQCYRCKSGFQRISALRKHLSKKTCQIKENECVCGLRYNTNRHICSSVKQMAEKWEHTIDCNICQASKLTFWDVLNGVHTHHDSDSTSLLREREVQWRSIFADMNQMITSNDEHLLQLGLALIMSYKYVIRTRHSTPSKRCLQFRRKNCAL